MTTERRLEGQTIEQWAERAKISEAALAECMDLTPRPEGTTINPALLHFLHGIAALDGVWFGDPHPAYRGVFWWRQFLPPYGESDESHPPQNGEGAKRD